MLACGSYEVEVLSTKVPPKQQGKAEIFKAEVRVVACDGPEATPEETVVEIFWTMGDKFGYGDSRLKQFTAAASGYANDAEGWAAYDVEDPNGWLLDAVAGERVLSNGEPNPFATADGSSPLAGRHMYVDVTKGKPVPDKDDFFRNYVFAPVVDAEPI